MQLFAVHIFNVWQSKLTSQTVRHDIDSSNVYSLGNLIATCSKMEKNDELQMIIDKYKLTEIAPQSSRTVFHAVVKQLSFRPGMD